MDNLLFISISIIVALVISSLFGTVYRYRHGLNTPRLSSQLLESEKLCIGIFESFHIGIHYNLFGTPCRFPIFRRYSPQ